MPPYIVDVVGDLSAFALASCLVSLFNRHGKQATSSNKQPEDDGPAAENSLYFGQFMG